MVACPLGAVVAIVAIADGAVVIIYLGVPLDLLSISGRIWSGVSCCVSCPVVGLMFMFTGL